MLKKRCIKIKEYEYLLEIKLVITQHQKSMDSFMNHVDVVNYAGTTIGNIKEVTIKKTKCDRKYECL